MITIRGFIQLLLLLALSLTASAKTWYVRADGGTRYVAINHRGQCDGLADAAYPGSGTNRHCAFNDVRYMWMDGTYGNSTWLLAGGDTLVIRGCSAAPGQQNPDNPHCRIGKDDQNGGGICQGVNQFWSCSMPPPPNGTAAQHTRILGGCAYDGNCTPLTTYPYTSNNLAQLFGGFADSAVIYLTGSQYVDLQGLEITSHNGQCTRLGYPSYPRGCSSGSPASDYVNWGIVTTDTTSNILLQDVYIHGMTNSGIQGPIGGPFTLARVSIDFNAFAGWNFDDGSKPSTPDAPGSSISATHVRMEGNGCLEEYPLAHAKFPALRCWDTEDGGFGDSWSGQDTKLDTFLCDHCVMAYNTKDGFIGPHTLITNLKITNSESYGNMGQQWKWGTLPGSTTIFENNLTVGNCRRMSEPMSGASSSYNRNLSGFCRAAGDIFSFFTSAHSTVLFANNTTIGYSATTFDLGCAAQKACGSTNFVFRNNIVLGYLNPHNNPAEVPGLFYYSDPSVKVDMDHDIFFNLRSKPCPLFGHSDLVCTTPAFVNQPGLTLTGEAQLDNFNFHPSSASPATGHGVVVSGVATDHYGKQRPSAPSIGAAEPSR